MKAASAPPCTTAADRVVLGRALGPRLRLGKELATACFLAPIIAVAGCRGWTADQAPLVPIRNMHDQQRYDAQQASEFFGDGRTMRPEVAHTVPREAEPNEAVRTGLSARDGGYALAIPDVVVERAGGLEDLMRRGGDRFNIYCGPCHDGSGSGKGTVVQRNAGMPPPPTFHNDRIRHMPDGQLFSTITNGIRNMPAYGTQIPVDDRWAIVSYVRVLQVSQAAR
ncbi:MAG: cytochrome c [Proteobacteria bacterium]|nr:cytochrome c [Pseudomonadota bacterium]